MAFYIKPPDGFGSLEKLRTSTLRRMSFLVDVVACPEATDFQALLEIGTSAVDSDCLIEGSRKDRMCHFFLRLICSQDTGLSSFFVQSETALFCHRFACMNCEELIHLLSSTHRFLLRRHKRQSSQGDDGFFSPQQDGRRKPFVPSMTLRAYSSHSDALNDLLDVLNRILKSAGCSWEKAVTAYMKYDTAVFRVPFQHALCLVASRQVNLEQGEALVRFSDLHVVLAAMFESVVRNGIKIAQLISHRVLEDSRLHEIARDVTSLYYARLDRYQWRGHARMRGDGTTIREWQLDQLHFFFPPCMANLHRMLRRKHRLRHFSRIQYTLFLKGIGLPVADAIHMWEKEYSKPSHCHDDSGSKQAGCRHTWAKDGRRYTYNIRHLYGLEGSRTDYRPHSCRTIQGDSHFGILVYRGNQTICFDDTLSLTQRKRISTLVCMEWDYVGKSTYTYYDLGVIQPTFSLLQQIRVMCNENDGSFSDCDVVASTILCNRVLGVSCHDAKLIRGSEYEGLLVLEGYTSFIVCHDDNSPRDTVAEGRLAQLVCQHIGFYGPSTYISYSISESLGESKPVTYSCPMEAGSVSDCDFSPANTCNDVYIYISCKEETDDETCRGRCGQFNSSYPCQCNPPCVRERFDDCCVDYVEECTDRTTMTTVSTVTKRLTRTTRGSEILTTLLPTELVTPTSSARRQGHVYGAIAGAGITLLVISVVVVFVIFFIVRKRKRTKGLKYNPPANGPAPVVMSNPTVEQSQRDLPEPSPLEVGAPSLTDQNAYSVDPTAPPMSPIPDGGQTDVVEDLEYSYIDMNQVSRLGFDGYARVTSPTGSNANEQDSDSTHYGMVNNVLYLTEMR